MWAEAFRQALCTREVEKVPEGFFMTQQWADILTMSNSHTRRMLLDGVAAGKVELASFRVAVGRIIRKEAHYRILGSRLGSRSPGKPLSPSAGGR